MFGVSFDYDCFNKKQTDEEKTVEALRLGTISKAYKLLSDKKYLQIMGYNKLSEKDKIKNIIKTARSSTLSFMMFNSRVDKRYLNSLYGMMPQQNFGGIIQKITGAGQATVQFIGAKKMIEPLNVLNSGVITANNIGETIFMIEDRQNQEYKFRCADKVVFCDMLTWDKFKHSEREGFLHEAFDV